MEIIITTELIIMIANAVAGVVAIVIIWQKQKNQIYNLQEKFRQNEEADHKLQKKVEELELLHTDLKLIERDFKEHRTSIHNAMLDIKESIVSLTKKIEEMVINQNKLFTEIEVLKKTIN